MQNNQEEVEAELTGLVQLLQDKIEALKEHQRHIERQKPKPKKKTKQAALNVEKQKTKYKEDEQYLWKGQKQNLKHSSCGAR